MNIDCRVFIFPSGSRYDTFYRQADKTSIVNDTTLLLITGSSLFKFLKSMSAEVKK